MTKKVDLFDLDLTGSSNEGAPVELKHPATGKPLNIIITVAGKDSGAYKSESLNLNRGRLIRAKKNNSFDLDAEDFDLDATKILAACTVSWDGVIFEGKELECNLKNAEMLYNARPWIKEQIDAVVQDRSNFMKG